MNLDPDDSRVRTDPRPGWGTVAIVAAFYVLCVGVATWPRVLWFRSCLPSLDDPFQHLWIMRWYKACLLEGKSLVLCPDLQYPTGAPLGCFSPLQFQALLYIPLSIVVSNDVLCYNLLWMFGLVTTGLGTFLLAWHVVRDVKSAAFGGMLAMLSAPMLLHGASHLELIYLGAFPLFLWTWLRLFDRPGAARLVAATGAYFLVAACAAYFAVYAIFPAALYFFWKGWADRHEDRDGAGIGGLRGAWRWYVDRGRWLLAFSVLVVPGLALLFGNQIWVMSQGYALPRSFAEFRELGAPLWSFACPTGLHALGREFAISSYAQSGLGAWTNECCSYLGVVALGLVAYAAAFRVRFREMSYWWACLALLVVLAGGTAWNIAGHEITLPGLWLKKHFILFRTIRAPARFNLYAAVIAGLVASCGLHDMLTHLPRRWMRGALLAALTAGAVADLAIVPYYRAEIPKMPGCYAFMEKAAPGAPFVEVPQFISGGFGLNSVCTYWQSIHRGRTTAGYCGQGNAHFDNLLSFNSPFFSEAIARPTFLEDPERIPLALDGVFRFHDYVWLYLKAHDLRFVVVHRWPGAVDPAALPGLDRLNAALASSKVYEDAGSIVYDRDRLPLPTRPVMITTGGWRIGEERAWVRVAERSARLLVYIPDPSHSLSLTIAARSPQEPREVRLTFEGKALARWSFPLGKYRSLASPPFRLPGGLHELVIESDGASRPRSRLEAASRVDQGPYSMKVYQVELADEGSRSTAEVSGKQRR